MKNALKSFTTYIMPLVLTLGFSQVTLSATSLVNTGTLGGTNSYAAVMISGGGGNIINLLSADGTALVGTSQITADAEDHAFLWRNGSMTDLGTLGGAGSMASGVSSDGMVVVGVSANGNGDTNAFRWENGAMANLGTLGGNYAMSFAVSADGNVVVGSSTDLNGNTHAFRWANNNMADLGTLGGDESYALAVSGDGLVVVGLAEDGANNSQAFRWVNGSMTNITAGLNTTFSSASMLSHDGSVVAGIYEDVNSNARSFRWMNGTATDIGTLVDGSNTFALTLSGDGSTIGGYAETTGGALHGFIERNGTMTDIGTLGGNFVGISSLSYDGNVAVGLATLPGDTDYALFRWSQGTGLETFEQILDAGNVDYTGWTFTSANPFPAYLSADGTVIAGTAILNGNVATYLIGTDGVSGPVLITPEEVAESVAAVSVVNQQTHSSFTGTISQSLMATRQAFAAFFSATPRVSSAPSGVAAGSAYHAPQSRAVYAIGSFGGGQNNDFDNYVGAGTTGFFQRVNPELAVGAGLLASRSRTDMHLGGLSTVQTYGAALNMAYEGMSGLRLYGSAGLSAIDLDMRRHYMNGGGVSSSRGDTNGLGYGVSARGGYEMAMARGTSVMPYLELAYSHTKIDGYTEHSGGAPATFADQSSDIVTSRLGVEVAHHLTPQLQLRTRAAWGHEVSSDGDGLTATSMTVTATVPYSSSGDQNWAEGGVTGIWKVSDSTSLIADLQLKAGDTAEPTVVGTAGVTVGF